MAQGEAPASPAQIARNVSTLPRCVIHTIRLRRREGPRPPPDHNAALGAAVYTAFGEAHPGEARDLHDAPTPSSYVLSEIYPAHGVGADAYWFRMGCTDDALGRRLVGALVQQGKLRVKDAMFQVEGVQDVTPLDVGGPVAFHTLSPILLREKDSRYCILSEVAKRNGTGPDPAYGARLQEVANHALRRERPGAGEIEVGATLPGKPRKRDLHGSTVYAQTVRFYADGSPEALAYLLARGIGWSRSHAFGCLGLQRE